MIVKEDFLNKLRRYFDLNLYEAKLWAALLSRGVSSAGELSDIGDVPRSRSYDVLESLEKKGFVIMKLGKPIKYIAVPPSEVIERVKKNMRDLAEEKVKKLESLKDSDILNELDTLHSQGVELIEPTDLSGAIRGRPNIYNHLDSVIKNAKENITLVTTTDGFIRKTDSLKHSLKAAKKRGVDIKIAAPMTSNCKDAIKELKDIAEIRHIDDPSARFCLVDNKDLIFMVLHDKEVHPSYDLAVWCNSAYFTSAVNQMFTNNWTTLKTPEEILN